MYYMLTDSEIGSIVQNELESALDYEGEISRKREQLMDYYNAQPYGDEIEGQSQVVTTDVADVVEGMLPGLLQIFTQGKTVGHFDPLTLDDEEEAKEKTFLANHLFLHEHDGVRILHDAFKDSLLQFTGTVKVFWDETKDTRTTQYDNLSPQEYAALLMRPEITLHNVEENEDGTFKCDEVKITTTRGITYENIPPEEFLIAKSARNFKRPVFIGHRSPKTRSELKKMGFDSDLVDSLPADEYYEYTGEKNARYHDYDNWQDINAGQHRPNDILYVGEYYMELDVNEDGITEYWQVIYSGNTVLDKKQVEDHPFAVMVPIPIPHRAIGTCPAEQTADIQRRKTALTRQAMNNIYQTNFTRFAHSNMVDLDDLLTPRPGGAVGIDTDGPDVQGHLMQIMSTPMLEPILAAIEQTESEREARTGVTRYNQGLDTESLNKTATGFMGIRDMSQQRMMLVAKLLSEGVRQIFEKTVALLAQYQDGVVAVRDNNMMREIMPKKWGTNTRCRIDVGIGAGDRLEKVANLNAVIQRQLDFMDRGLLLADQPKMFHALDKLCEAVGLKEANPYFNDPDVPEETLHIQNQQLVQMVQQLQQQVQSNPLAEAEMIKAQAKMAEVKGKSTTEMIKFVKEMAQKDKHFLANLRKELTEMELKYQTNVPGALM